MRWKALHRDKKLKMLTTLIILSICLAITVTFHFVDKKLGFYLGFVRAIFYLCAGMAFCFLTYSMLNKRNKRDHAGFRDIGILILKLALLCAGFVCIVVGMFAIGRPCEADICKGMDWIICIFGIFLLIMLFFLVPRIKRWWKHTTISEGMLSLIFILSFAGIGIFSIIGGGVEFTTHIQDLFCLDKPQQVMLFHCTSVRKHTSRSVFYTQMKGYDEFGEVWTFDLSTFKMSEDAHDGYCIVEYLPHTKTVMSLSFLNDGIDWED